MLEIDCQNELMWLLPERALFRPTHRTLYIADTHWGKVATFQAHGISLPEGGLADDLGRLSAALDRTGATRLVILGDLTHSHHSFAPSVIETVARWRANYGDLLIQLVIGNHDRSSAALPSTWGIEIWSEHELDFGVRLAHEPAETSGAFRFCGHLHPTWRLSGHGRQQVSLPCWMRTESQLIFPAFSPFTGRTTYDLPNLKAVYGITPERVIRVR